MKSYELKIEVNPDYHPKIIGRRGTVVSSIRTKHDVQINFPKKGDPEENIITITGYEQNTHTAKEEIMKIVSELVGFLFICFIQKFMLVIETTQSHQQLNNYLTVF